LLGLPGIGKSSLARSVLQYLYERRYFLGGMIFVQGKGVGVLERLVKEIMLKLFLKADKEKIKKITAAPPETVIEELISQFNYLS